VVDDPNQIALLSPSLDSPHVRRMIAVLEEREPDAWLSANLATMPEMADLEQDFYE